MASKDVPPAADDLSDELRLGDEAFGAERFDEAAEHYRAAAAAAPDTPGLAARLERSVVNATTGIGRGEHQNAVFAGAYARNEDRRRLAGSARPRHPAARAAAARRPAPPGQGRRRASRGRGRLGVLPRRDQRARAQHQRPGVDQLVHRREGAARACVEVGQDPQARAHARVAVREQPRAHLPRGRQDRVRRGPHAGARVRAALADGRRHLERPAPGRRRAGRPDGGRGVHPLLPQPR